MTPNCSSGSSAIGDVHVKRESEADVTVGFNGLYNAEGYAQPQSDERRSLTSLMSSPVGHLDLGASMAEQSSTFMSQRSYRMGGEPSGQPPGPSGGSDFIRRSQSLQPTVPAAVAPPFDGWPSPMAFDTGTSTSLFETFFAPPSIGSLQRPGSTPVELATPRLNENIWYGPNQAQAQTQSVLGGPAMTQALDSRQFMPNGMMVSARPGISHALGADPRISHGHGHGHLVRYAGVSMAPVMYNPFHPTPEVNESSGEPGFTSSYGRVKEEKND